VRTLAYVSFIIMSLTSVASAAPCDAQVQALQKQTNAAGDRADAIKNKCSPEWSTEFKRFLELARRYEGAAKLDKGCVIKSEDGVAVGPNGITKKAFAVNEDINKECTAASVKKHDKEAAAKKRSTEEPANEDHWKEDAPFPKLQYGQKLCMSSIPPGDPFYKQCQACEKKISECSGDLRDRGRRSPYGDPDAYMVAATSDNNENSVVMLSKKSRAEAIKEAVRECSAGGRFVCKNDEISVTVWSYRGKAPDIHMDIDKNTCVYFSRSKDADKKSNTYWLSRGRTPKEAAEGCKVDKWGDHHKCTAPTGMCAGK
jgi:hypothetical protein